MNGIKHLSFPQLVDRCAASILQELIRGHFRTGVYDALVLMGQWQQARETKKLTEGII